MSQRLEEKTAVDLAKKIKSRALSRQDIYFFFRERINKYNTSLNAFVSLYKECPQSDGLSSLSGLPVAVKDNICIENKKITCASKILAGHRAVYDATVIKKIKSAGLNLIGTTNMDEFAFGSSTENSCYGACRNPWDTTRVTGGSSGGSAAAVAARLAPLALGSDTAGSVRQPASLCGVVGFKPTYGRVSRLGLVAFGSSLDQIGPITTSIKDAAHLLNIISGPDSLDSTSSSADCDFTQALGREISSLKVGIPKEYFGPGLDSEVREAVNRAISFFKKKRVRFKEVSLPHTSYAIPTYYVISSSEASSNLQRFDGIRYGQRAAGSSIFQLYKQSRTQGLGRETKRRILLGTYSLASGYYELYYAKALRVRKLIKNDFLEAFKDVDALLTPTSPTAAFKAGEKLKDPLAMYLSDIYTISANLAGNPAVSLPCGFNKDNLPVGLQLIGREFDEKTIIKLGDAFQAETDWHKKIPEIE